MIDGDLENFAHTQIPSFEEEKTYFQKFKQGDQIGGQWIVSDKDLIYWTGATVDLIDCTGASVQSLTVYRARKWFGTSRSYVVIDTIGAVANGIYFLKVVVPSDIPGEYITLVSEPLSIRDDHENTLAIWYGNDAYVSDFDLIYGSVDQFPVQNFIRVEGGVKSDGFQPGGKFQQYADLEYQQVILKATPFNIYKFTFGDNGALPNWMADKLNRIFFFPNVFINKDGAQTINYRNKYIRAEGAKMEPQRESLMPFAVWTFDLMEVENYMSDIFGAGTSSPTPVVTSIRVENGTLTLNLDNSYSATFTFDGSFSDTDYAYIVTARDADGNTVLVTETLATDSITVTSPNEETCEVRVIVIGSTAEANQDTKHIEHKTVTLNAGNSYTAYVAFDVAFTDNAYEYGVTGRDASGNTVLINETPIAAGITVTSPNEETCTVRIIAVDDI